MSRRFASQMIGAYRGRQFHGCLVDADGVPNAIRQRVRYEKDRFKRECRNGHQAEDVMSGPILGSGKGQRAINFRYFLSLDPENAYKNYQDYGNCTAQMTGEDVDTEIGVDIAVRKEPEAYVAKTGTAVTYGHRGTSSQGMALATAMRVIHNVAVQLRKPYCDGRYDFTDEDTDEAYGNNWGRSGVPSDLLAELEGTGVEQVSTATEEEACLDLLFNGYALGHGSQLTARPNGRLISTLESIGGHAQPWLGYDDTQEFRDWYYETTGNRLTDWVAINGQSWGPNWNNFPIQYWPTHLWGPRMEGAWVVTGRDQMKIIRQWNDCYAISNVVGFPARQIPPWEDAFDWL